MHCAEEVSGDTWVALRKESVDRNDVLAVSAVLELMVALRKESVDRNGGACARRWAPSWSLSARRAWIEIRCVGCSVRLLAPSLSARRAWIEITTYFDTSSMDDVALRKESVDRNDRPPPLTSRAERRSPQGERG